MAKEPSSPLAERILSLTAEQRRSLHSVAVAASIPITTFNRCIYGVRSFKTDELDRVARELGTYAWQLLKPEAVEPSDEAA